MRLVTAILAFAILTSNAFAQDYVPDRRLIVHPNQDFYGADLSKLFNTTLDACERACLSNQSCQAFTFNHKSNACFPKSGVSDQLPFDGATSAQIAQTGRTVLANAPSRTVDLSFLNPNDLAAALDRANGWGTQYPAGGQNLQDLSQAATDAARAGDYISALRASGAAVSLLDTSNWWNYHARLALRVKTKTYSDERKYLSLAKDATINAYLRATSEDDQSQAAFTLSRVLERDNRGRDTLSALRLAAQTSERSDIQVALEDAIGKYGFRIIDTSVENNSANPRICAIFSEDIAGNIDDITKFVSVPDPRLVVQADDRQICVDGVQHGQRYAITFRQGLPAQSGEVLHKSVNVSQRVRDRDPSVSFAGRAFVLPKTGDATLPIKTVNVSQVDLTLRHVSDRNILRTMQSQLFGRPLSKWQEREFSTDVATQVWTGVGDTGNELNADITTQLPLADVLADQKAGVYALTASINDPDASNATQWFILTDIGLTTLTGVEGLTVFTRSLSTAQGQSDIALTLLSRANEVLGRAVTDVDGHAQFSAGLLRGEGGASAAVVMAQTGDDFAFLSLTDPAFDLSDRGVEGRKPAQPVDVFLTTDRGAYRPGETVFATVLVRDAQAAALSGVPITAILSRPDGVEYARQSSAKDVSGGHVFEFDVNATAPRGAWQLDMYVDTTRDTLASATVLVEDFSPERIDFELSANGQIVAGADASITLDAKYLFGAPAANMDVEGSATLRGTRSIKQYPGFLFGEYDALVATRTEFFGGDRTGPDGQAQITVTVPEPTTNDRPFDLTFTTRVNEGAGRPVERTLTVATQLPNAVIGIKAEFDDVVPEGTEAAFKIIGVDENLDQTALPIRWTVNRLTTRYQWYSQNGNWTWDRTTRRTRIATGTGITGMTITAPVDWGQYELLVETDDGVYVASSMSFYAGWYAPADGSSTPDTLDVSLDKPSYSAGDQAIVRVVPRYAGSALVTVLSNQVIDRKVVELTKGENRIPMDVTTAWGAGAYVTVQLIRAMDVDAGRNPTRALGLAYASIDPGDRVLDVKLSVPANPKPRAPLTVNIQVKGVQTGDTAYVTLAAVDLGVLNITGFDSPDPVDHYFGQRRLGVDIRDVYGRLIDGLNGTRGQVRSGGDAGTPDPSSTPPPNEDLVTFFQGPVQVDAGGNAQVTLDIPDFNGTLRLMAVAWSDTGVGQADTDVILSDPIAIIASAPRFLAPNDSSEILIDLVHVAGPAGDVRVTATGGFDAKVMLGENQKQTLTVPYTAKEIGDHQMTISVTTPDGVVLNKSITIPVRANDPAIATTRQITLAPGQTFTASDDLFAGLYDGTATLSHGPLAQMNVAGLLLSLDRYPYGCTEQITSRAMPLLYFNSVASQLGMGEDTDITSRIETAITRVLSRQSANGSFGLWRSDTGDLWLDAYTTEFLTRARTAGFGVPDHAMTAAIDNLRNRVNFAADFDNGGEGLAYALLILSQNGSALIGDLRYYADEKVDDFASGLALAQLAKALSNYGETDRADRLFQAALRKLAVRPDDTGWRSDYGSNTRDRAAILTLAVEADTTAINTNVLARGLGTAAADGSTQTQAWTLMAAHALIGEDSNAQIQTIMPGDSPVTVTNNSGADLPVMVTTRGVPIRPADAGGYGYQITRSYFDMDGNPVNIDSVQTGTRLVTVLRVTPFEDGGGRLMINDPLPAGFEIDNPNLLRSGDVKSLDWLTPPRNVRFSEARTDRYLAAVDLRSKDNFELAYIVRAVLPGTYHHPAATVEDMYRPLYQARTSTGQMRVTK